VENHDLVIIGSGFGATMTALTIAQEFKSWNDNNKDKPPKKILMLERGTWWTTPVGTVQDPKVETYDFLAKKNPVQFWPSKPGFMGAIDIFTRCFRRGSNKDGLFDISTLGPIGILGLFKGSNDGVTIARACGVGGGSLVYSNITIRPPELIFEDPRWSSLSWDVKERDHYFELARHAIGYGVISALNEKKNNNMPYIGVSLPKGSINAGLSNINTRSARINPHWTIKADPYNSRGIKQITIHDPKDPTSFPDKNNNLWIERAKVFQTAVSKLTDEFGTVDSSINDITPEGDILGQPPPYYPLEKSINYCERQGRCNVGCLPGARHTLNKQLMVAALGKFDNTPPTFDNLEIRTLTNVDYIEEIEKGGYVIHYNQYKNQENGKIFRKPKHKKQLRIHADKVIIAAGCLGTNEILLRSQRNKSLKNLSCKVGYGFSTNGDCIAFIENTNQRTRLTRGPVTTSYAHFNTQKEESWKNTVFHTIEDQGVPPALASLIGFGVPLLRSISKGRNRGLFVFLMIFKGLLKQLGILLRAPFVNYINRQDIFKSDDEMTANMMCVVGAGKEDSIGQFRLGGIGETSLRVRRTDGKDFNEDTVYTEINETLKKLSPQFKDPKDIEKEGGFEDPFQNDFLKKLNLKSLTISHPLGGCRIAKNVDEGVVDEFGRVFNKLKKGDEKPYYQGLYVADGSVIPTALGVNPSLTISSVTLRIAENIVKDFKKEGYL